MMRIRRLKVWFPLRRGLARELRGGASLWVRALDGVSFDVRRGEVFCLVGESGCGKTTTGKALLRLVDTTEGDVFLEMPENDYAEYEDLTKGPRSAESDIRVDRLRRKYSLTWTETIPWTWRQTLVIAAFVMAGFAVGLFSAVDLAPLFASGFADNGFLFVASILIGLGLGIVGTYPPSRLSRRTPVILSLLAILAFALLPVVVFVGFPTVFQGLATDAGGALGAAWGANTLMMLLGIMIAPAVAGGIGRAILGVRRDRGGMQGLRMRALRRRLHLIFQDPYESLNPKQSVFEIVSEPLTVNRVSRDPQEIAAIVSRSLEDAGLRPAEEFMFRFPHELSGGQRQRVSIAAALALEPDFIVADEPVSMLDVSIRTEILDLMMDLRKKRGITYLFITHDLSLAWIIADRIAVMYLGKVVEQGTTEQVIATPKHPYTQALISVVPSPDPRHIAKRTILKGERPDPVNIPTGCRFHPRCPFAFERCGWNTDEVAADFAGAEAEIAGKLQATLQGKREELRLLAPPVPDAASTAAPKSPAVEKLEREIADLEAAHRRATDLQALLKRDEEGAEAASAQGDEHTLIVPAPAGATAEEIAQTFRGLAAAQQNQRLSFKGITRIESAGGAVAIHLHEWSEPELIEIAPGNTVACHLVNAPQAGPVAPAMAATA